MLTTDVRFGLNTPDVVGAFTIGGRKKKCPLLGTQVPVGTVQFAALAPSEMSADGFRLGPVAGRSLVHANATTTALAASSRGCLMRTS